MAKHQSYERNKANFLKYQASKARLELLINSESKERFKNLREVSNKTVDGFLNHCLDLFENSLK